MVKKTIKKKVVKKKKPIDKHKIVEISKDISVQHVKVYPKYNPLRK
jgi:CxxC motif-containing protein